MQAGQTEPSGGNLVDGPKTVRQWLDHRGLTLAELVERTGMEKRVARQLVEGQWTASPKQRQAIAAALGLDEADITWGFATPVQHLYGHGPQFGRSP
jgi:transcriptional regulator with XRE-family HTH domain